MQEWGVKGQAYNSSNTHPVIIVIIIIIIMIIITNIITEFRKQQYHYSTHSHNAASDSLPCSML